MPKAGRKRPDITSCKLIPASRCPRHAPATSISFALTRHLEKTRVYEKVRFARTRQSQTAGEDLRDRWHNALKGLEDGVDIDPESVKMRNRWLYAYDAEADTIARWDEVSSRVEEELTSGKVEPLCTFTPKGASLGR